MSRNRKPALLACGAVAVLSVPAVAAAEPREVDEIVVTATRTARSLLDVPAAVSVHSLDDLRASGRFQTGTDEFRALPGVFVRRGEGDNDEGPAITLRGVTGNHGNDSFLALVDGIPFVGPDEEVLLQQVPYPAVERVEIVRGPVSSLYGRGAIAGAVNYITRTPSADGLRLEATLGSHGHASADALLEKAWSGGGGLLSLSYLDTQGWRQNSAREVLSLFGKAQVTLRPGWRLTVVGAHLDRDSEPASAIPTAPDGTPLLRGRDRRRFVGFGPTYARTRGTIGSLKLDAELTDNLTAQAVLSARTFDGDVRLNFYDPSGLDLARGVVSVNGFASPSTTDVLQADASLRWRRGRHDIIAGVSLEETQLDEEERWTGQHGFTPACGFAFYRIDLDLRSGAPLNAGHPCFARDRLQARDHATNRFAGAFLQDEIRLADGLTLTIGGRFDRFERTVAFDAAGAAPAGRRSGQAESFSPKAALSYRVGSGQAYVAYGRGFNSNFGQVYTWDPTQYARVEKPTTIDSVEVGWKGRALDHRLRVEAAAFYLEQKNRRVYASNPNPAGPPTLATTGQLYASKGIELAATFAPDADTTLSANYTWLAPVWKRYSLETFDGPLDLSGARPTGVPRHMFNAAAERRLTPWLRARASLEVYGDYAITQDNRFKGGGYELVTLSASIQPFQRRPVFLDIAVSNALDARYSFLFGDERAVTTASPGPPRQVQATLRVQL